MLRALSLGLVKGYQALLSPGRGLLRAWYPFQCRYSPSCSEYARQALEKYSFLGALRRIVWRLIRCHPWSKGGVDVP